MNLDRNLQRALLQRLRDAYPELVNLADLDLFTRDGFHANAFYLISHGLIEASAFRQGVVGAPSQVIAAKITAAGLDFLEDDGGLGAILGTITVKIDPATLRALLEARIDESTLPAPEKTRLKSKLGELAGKAAEKVFWRLLDELLKHPDILIGVMKGLS